MKRLLPVLMVFGVFLGSAGESSALPECPKQRNPTNSPWLNCFGTYTYPKGGKYVGEYKDDKRDGQGTFTYANGNKYVGEWKNGKFHGQGTSTSADGDKYVGEFQDGRVHGQGTYTYADGRKYVGELKDTKRHGQGTYISADGRKYVGEWKNNKMHGQGIRYRADGTVEREGVWENDELQYAQKVMPTVTAKTTSAPSSRPKTVLQNTPERPHDIAVIIANLKFKTCGREYMAFIPIIKSRVQSGLVLVLVPIGWIDRLNHQSDKPMLDKVLEYF